MAKEDKFMRVWRADGIEDAILNSTVAIKQPSQAMQALVGFWCLSTSTFVLPWGEVGFTLEDAHILGNLPVWVSPLQCLLTEEEERLRLRLRLVEARELLRKILMKSGLKTSVTHFSCLNWFLKLENDDGLLHLGFLAYWLSRNVVACKLLHEVPHAVFGIAARLSRGEMIALASAVMANIYCDLATITKLLYNCQSRNRNERIKIELWVQFRLLQSWLWERFDHLSLIVQNPISQRSSVSIARLDNKNIRPTYDAALEAFYDSQSFVWWLYVNGLQNLVKPQWYTGDEKSIVVDECSPIWVYDVLTIISAAGLVGFATEETMLIGQYKPYRVSMQLGYDQAIPMSASPSVTSWDSNTMCDPSGNYVGWKAAAIGSNNAVAQSMLKLDYKEDISREEAVRLVLKVLSKTMDSTSLTSKKLELAEVFLSPLRMVECYVFSPEALGKLLVKFGVSQIASTSK